MLKVKGVLPLHRSCFPVISVDKQTPSYIPTKADRVSTSWNSITIEDKGITMIPLYLGE